MKTFLLSNSRIDFIIKSIFFSKQFLDIVLILFNIRRVFCDRFLKAILFIIAIELTFAFSTMTCVLKALRIFGIHNVLEVVFDTIETLRIDEIAISEHQVNLTFAVGGTSVRHDDNITYRRNVTIKGSGTR